MKIFYSLAIRETKKHHLTETHEHNFEIHNIGPIAQHWRWLSLPKSRFRDGRGTARWAAIACIAQLDASP